MKLSNHPGLVERLAAAYALGTLRGAARRRFETLARQDPSIRASALVWQSRFAGLVELQPAVAPPPELWSRIDAQLTQQAQAESAAIAAAQGHRLPASASAGNVRKPETASDRWRSGLAFWRPAALGAAVVAGLALVVGLGLRAELEGQVAQWRAQSQLARQRAEAAQQQLATTQRVEYVAVLADDKSTASILVTFDPTTRRLTLKRVGGYREADDKSLQLWVIAPGSGPRSLGVLDNAPVVRLTAQEGDVSELPTLAISLEPKGGVTSGGPTGPVLFKGAVLKTAL
ncbi:MAG: anti-sigma factor [Burkholderiaceae bacterium]